MSNNKSQTNFNAGEISPRLAVRSDLAKYENACVTMLNGYALPHGGWTRRPGFRYIAAAKNANKKSRLIPFSFSTTQSYVLEFGESYMRVFKDQGIVTGTLTASTDLLVHFDGVDAAVTFTDEVGTHTLTASGNAQVDSGITKPNFAQSLLLDGDDDYVAITDHAELQLGGGSGDFTLECYVRFDAASGTHCIWSQHDSTATDYVVWYVDLDSQRMVFATMDAGSGLALKETPLPSTISAETWHHVAVIRESDNLRFTVDGQSSASSSVSGTTMPNHDQAVRIGNMIKTVIVDVTSDQRAVTVNGTAQLVNTSDNMSSGALLLDGNSDYLSVADHADWDITQEANVQIDLWVKHTDHAGTETYLCHYEDANNYWVFEHIHGTGLRFAQVRSGLAIIELSGGEITDTDWHYVSLICGNGDEWALYLDGTQTATVTGSSSDTLAGALYIGATGAPGNYFDGYMEQVRLRHSHPEVGPGADPPPASLTVPTAPSTGTPTATKLHLHCNTMDFDGNLDELRLSTSAIYTTFPFSPSGPFGGGSAYELDLTSTFPILESELSSLTYTQSADTLYLAHPNHEPVKITRTDHNAWTVTENELNDGPYEDQNTTATTLDPAALTGNNVALVASSTTGINNDTGFQSTDVGRLVTIKYAVAAEDFWGVGRIDQVTDTTNARIDILRDFKAHTATIDWKLGEFSNTTGFPSIVQFHQNRLVYANNANRPDRLWFSNLGDYARFVWGVADATAENPGLDQAIADDDAITTDLVANQVNAILWMVSSKALLVGTSGAEWSIFGDTSVGITPTALNQHQQSNRGSEALKPVVVGDAVLFIQRVGKKVIQYKYDVEVDSFISDNIILLAEHLTREYKITAWAFQSEPNDMIWSIRADGALLALTYNVRQQIASWHRHTTDGVVEDLTVIPGDNRDELWINVKRTINGSVVRYIELMEAELNNDSSLDGNRCLDSGLAYSGPAATVFSGLDHLEGETIVAWADGVAVDATVASGGFTLATAASTVYAGLDYNSDLEPMLLVWSDTKGTNLARTLRITRSTLRTYQTGTGFYVGPDSSNLVPITFSDITGNIDIDLADNYDKETSVFVRANKGMPFTALSITNEADASER